MAKSGAEILKDYSRKSYIRENSEKMSLAFSLSFLVFLTIIFLLFFFTF